jgi:hypothetical protein
MLTSADRSQEKPTERSPHRKRGFMYSYEGKENSIQVEK